MRTPCHCEAAFLGLAEIKSKFLGKKKKRKRKQYGAGNEGEGIRCDSRACKLTQYLKGTQPSTSVVTKELFENIHDFQTTIRLLEHEYIKDFGLKLGRYC